MFSIQQKIVGNDNDHDEVLGDAPFDNFDELLKEVEEFLTEEQAKDLDMFDFDMEAQETTDLTPAINTGEIILEQRGEEIKTQLEQAGIVITDNDHRQYMELLIGRFEKNALDAFSHIPKNPEAIGNVVNRIRQTYTHLPLYLVYVPLGAWFAPLLPSSPYTNTLSRSIRLLEIAIDGVRICRFVFRFFDSHMEIIRYPKLYGQLTETDFNAITDDQRSRIINTLHEISRIFQSK